MTLETLLKSEAEAVGFDVCRICRVDEPWLAGAGLEAFVEAGYHGTMDWMAQTLERRKHPQAMWNGARSAVVLGLNYGPEQDPMVKLTQRGTGNISVYAQGKDYHDVVKKKLRQMARRFAEVSGEDVKIFVDTAPLMEKPLAQKAGIGWQGKHTNVVSRDLGSWLFLGVILTSAALSPDAAEVDHCGRCTQCLDACPTKAFVGPYQLDARRCISYLTIEHKGVIPVEFRAAMANRIYGCDDCLAVCPWNKFAQTAADAALWARAELKTPALDELLALDEAGFREVFSGSPIKRIGHERFIRNVLIAAGNSGDPALVDACLVSYLDADISGLRAAAIWALGRLDPARFEREKAARLDRERDEEVKAEWLRGA